MSKSCTSRSYSESMQAWTKLRSALAVSMVPRLRCTARFGGPRRFASCRSTEDFPDRFCP